MMTLSVITSLTGLPVIFWRSSPATTYQVLLYSQPMPRGGRRPVRQARVEQLPGLAVGVAGPQDGRQVLGAAGQAGRVLEEPAGGDPPAVVAVAADLARVCRSRIPGIPVPPSPQPPLRSPLSIRS
ncbi:hypothetical protein [Nonomuraea monospora]|uniref:hypothetical protein n=1 Tax=Nonomuraea monospora TaxID=568818 RepID=UPI0031CF4C6D